MFPHLLTARNVPPLVKTGYVDWDSVDAAFCCLPHATTQVIINQLPRHIKVVDLSADFRLKDVNMYAEWYVLSPRPPTTTSCLSFASPFLPSFPKHACMDALSTLFN